ncbi:MAG: hypothetical protein GC192_21830 [Bacteroidetes bacterium]|nr:hypothetical protein [Bacteroidota bacterium]
MRIILSNRVVAFSIQLFSIALIFSFVACGNSHVENQSTENTSTTPKAEAVKQEAPSTGSPESFHAGKFIYEDEVKFGKMYITRTDDTQTDVGGPSDLTLKFGITWETPTTYTLRMIGIFQKDKEITLPEHKNMVRNCFMTEITEDGYTEVSTSNVTVGDTLRTRILRVK